LNYSKRDPDKKIGLGGGCHWCTEAVFQSLRGVTQVEQGFIASTGKATAFSEAVLLNYNPLIISLDTLIEIHLRTHEATSNHSFRSKYRSAIYFLQPEDEVKAREALNCLQKEFGTPLVTQVLPVAEFNPSRKQLQNYYLTDPYRPFCRRYIEPKIQQLLDNFGKTVDILKLNR